MKKRQNIRKFLLLISFILYPMTFFIMSPDLLVSWILQVADTGAADL